MKSQLKKISHALKERYYLHNSASALPGSKEWLIGAELKYGGLQVKVPRNKVSPSDPRSEEQINRGGMTGGDRMLHHGYAAKYSEHLQRFVKQERALNVAEFGILRGNGLAVWCDLFVGGRVLGFDIDLGHTKGNMENLKALGAFRENQPELHEYDQFEDNIEYLGGILKDDKIDICIDDGFHSNESILKTMESVLPYLAEDAVYFIEDNKHVHEEIAKLYPHLSIDHFDELTVLNFKPTQNN